MDLASEETGRKRPALAALAVVAAIYVATLLLLPAKGLWVVDNAAKFLQVKAAIASDYSDYAVAWPGSTIDPDFNFRPIPDPFAYVSGGRMYVFYPPFFAAVSSLPYRLLGFRGLCLLPLVGSLAMLWAVRELVRHLKAGTAAEVAAILVVGLATPVWFYSVVFWEHTIAAGLCLWSVLLMLRFVDGGPRRDIIVAGLVAAGGVYFRDELYLFCALIVIAATWWRRPRSWATAAVAVSAIVVGLVPLWFFQWRATGSPLGHHLAGLLASESGVSGHIATRPAALYNLLVAAAPRHWLSFIASGPFLVMLVVYPRLAGERYRWAVPVLSAIAVGGSVVSLAGYFGPGSPIDYMIESCNSFLTVCPVLMLAFIRLGQVRGGFSVADGAQQADTALKRIWGIAVAYAAAYALAAPELGTSGMHWGNRFLLVCYPLFGVLAGVNLVQWGARLAPRIRWQWAVVGAVIAISIAAQVYGLTLLHKKEDFSARLNQAVHSRPEQVIITQVAWAPSDMYLEFGEKLIFLAPTREGFGRLVQTLGERGYATALLAADVPVAQAAGAAFTVDDEGLNFFTLRFFELQIGTR